MAKVTGPQVGALISAVATISCNGAQSASRTETPASPPTVDVQPAAGRVAPVQPTAEPAPAAPHDERLAALRGRKEWRWFKELWRELDAVEPSPEPGRDVYAHTVDSSRAEQLSTRLDDRVRDLEQSKLLSPDEAAFFRHAVATRIRNMQHGSMPLMVMHRMPPPYAWKKFASVDQLEGWIDLLIALRAKGQVGADEYANTLELVRREAVTLYVLYELGQGGHGLGVPTIEGADGERMLREIGRRVGEAGADAGAHEQHLAEIFERATKLVPQIRALVTELER